jgi:putative methyltransferase (TIGR04325 family)
MTFGYVLVLAAREKSTISLLDWGSGIGHYALFARALLPEVRIDYHGMDFPALCEEGRRVLPEATFLDTGDELDGSYDLVVASGALQYADRWSSTLGDLLRAAGSFIYIVTTVVRHAPSFVVVQRPYKYGYDTDLTQWMLNRDELVSVAEEHGFTLRREFLNEEMAPIEGAPERGATVGFLFER